MMIRHSTQLRNPYQKHVVAERRRRLRKILELNAPEIIVIQFVENYLRSFKWSWYGIWQDIKVHHFPRWFLWLTDADYREACRGVDEDFERDLRETLGVAAKGDEAS